ncbi:hypothetical protein, partial [Actinoallomurus acaciae]
GRSRRLAWGPEAHGGSSYQRPGDEWGAGYRFDRPGCWDLHAVRGTATADVWIEVGRRPRTSRATARRPKGPPSQDTHSTA